ncbi:SNF2 family N-terminal domain-containing protein [Gongronella butleri]|nr:SNF2 family N-terminal domain-containing protein [Gongronella butleri]
MDDDTKVLRFFNHATLQELMDITTAKSTLVNKLIGMRPFTTMDDLERKLRDQKGLSARAIQTYRDMMDGFYRVDRLITQIEDVGAPVLRIIDVWERLGNQISDHSGKKQSRMGEKGDDDDTTEFDAATKADAMDGYLTSQPATMTTALQLKDYQLTGVNWMLMLFRKGISGILADEMGLGKTAQVISFLARIVELGHTGPHLVVVPTSTVDNWVREFGRFCPALKLLVYQGSIKERMALQDDIDQALDADELNVIITTYAIAAHRIEDRRFFRSLGCQSIILDEGHMVKNCNSARYGNLMSIKAPFRLLLTGTPLQNNLQELISLLMFIMPATFEGHETAVRQIFKLHDKHQVEASAAQLLSQQRIERAKRMMQPFVLRRRKCQVLRHLPKKFQVVDRSPMLPEQQKIYNDIIRDSQARDKEITEKKALIASLRKNGNESDGLLLDTLGSRPISSSYSNIIMHLRKAVDHPLLFRKIYTDSILHDMARDIMKEERYWDADVNYIYEDMTVMSDFELHGLCKQFKSVNKYALCKEEWMNAGKVRRLQTLLQKHKQQGDKVLLFSQFTMMLDILERVMATLGMRYLRLDGNTKQIDRQPLIDQFNDTPNFDVFLLSTKAGGFGINLTAANVVILYDMDFNPHNDRQAEDRAHRVGQVQDVTVYRLIADKSIEETILAMNEVKMRMDQSISNLDGDSQKNEPEGAMNQADVGKLIKSILKQSPLA